MNMKKIISVLSVCALVNVLSLNVPVSVNAVDSVSMQTINAQSDAPVAIDYLGIWECERCTITISEEDDGNGYLVQVYWTSSALEHTEWTYRHCSFFDVNTAANFICTDEATCIDCVVKENQEEPEFVTKYTKGSGSFAIDNDVLVWNDSEEHCADGLEFTKVDTDTDAPTASDYLDIWECERCTITISKEEDGNGLLVQVYWTSSALEHTEWTYRHCQLAATSTVVELTCTNEATCIECVVKENQEEPEFITKYTNGSGLFKVNTDNSVLVWEDSEEHCADDLEFTRAGAIMVDELSASDYFGTWKCGEYTLTISKEADGIGYYYSCKTEKDVV